MSRNERSSIERADINLRILTELKADPYAKPRVIAEKLGISRSDVTALQRKLAMRLEEKAETLIQDYQRMLLTSLPLEERADIIGGIARLSKDDRARLKAIEDADKLGQLRNDRIDATIHTPDMVPDPGRQKLTDEHIDSLITLAESASLAASDKGTEGADEN